MQVNIHRVPGQRPQEKAGSPNGQRFAGTVERQSLGQGFRQQLGDFLIVVTPPDGFPDLADRCCFVIAGLLAGDAGQ
jgi:hypothetical protein